MKRVFTISTKEFEPLSIDRNYLYDQYDRIHAFLRHKFRNRYQNVLAKPVLVGDQVHWYAEFNNELSRLSDLSESDQIAIKTQYWEVIKSVEDDISQLESARDDEKQNWARLLREVFNGENNIILSDGTNWCLLWGCKYRNQRENYLSPDFMPINKPKVEGTEGDKSNGHTQIQDPVPVDDLDQEEIEYNEPPFDDEPLFDDEGDVYDNGKANYKTNEESPKRPVPPVSDKVKTGLGTTLLHFFRRLIYKIWALLFFIMLLLMIACLCKRCCIEKLQQNCGELNQLNSKILKMEQKINDKCKNGK